MYNVYTKLHPFSLSKQICQFYKPLGVYSNWKGAFKIMHNVYGHWCSGMFTWEMERDGGEKRDRLRKLLCYFWDCRCRTWNVSFSVVMSRILTVQFVLQKTKLWAGLFMAHSLVILVTVLDAAACEISVSLKVLQHAC